MSIDANIVAYFINPFLAFLTVVLLIMPMRRVARSVGLVDRPGGRKRHVKEVPLIGGLVIFSVFLSYGFASGLIDLSEYWALYVGLSVLLCLGVLDDHYDLPAWLKFGAHIFATLFIVAFGAVQAAYLGDLFGFGDVWTGPASYPFTVVAIVLLINAMNLTDGLDGLAGGISFVMFFWLALASFLGGHADQGAVIVLLMACIAGFLIFNMRSRWRRKASLFLGDAGSMCLGLVIAWFAVRLTNDAHVALMPISVAWIIGFPIFDTCAQFYRRISEGHHPFDPDRGHFHHHFIDAGVPVWLATPCIIFIVFVMGAIGYGGILVGVPQVILSLGWLALLFAHIAMSRKPERYVHLIGIIFASKRSLASDE